MDSITFPVQFCALGPSRTLVSVVKMSIYYLYQYQTTSNGARDLPVFTVELDKRRTLINVTISNNTTVVR